MGFETCGPNEVMVVSGKAYTIVSYACLIRSLILRYCGNSDCLHVAFRNVKLGQLLNLDLINIDTDAL